MILRSLRVDATPTLPHHVILLEVSPGPMSSSRAASGSGGASAPPPGGGGAPAASYRDATPLDRRLAESQRIRAKYPDRVPVIVEKAANKTIVPDIDKAK